MSEIPAAPAGPVQPEERIILLDILRAFAIFGILVVNVLFYSGPLGWILVPPWTELPDLISSWIITVLFSGKFYSTFSILFGLGFAMQTFRAWDRGETGGGRYARRLVVLFFIGIAHAALIWYGDILHLYAVLGFFLFLFRRAPLNVLLIVAVIALMVPVGLAFLGAAVMEVIPPGDSMSPEAAAESLGTSEALEIYSAGSWGELTLRRIRDWLMLDLYSIFFAPNVFAMFLVGLWAGRKGLYRGAPEHRPFFRRLLIIALPLGLAMNLIVLSLEKLNDNPMMPSWMGAFHQLAYAIGVPMLAFGYIAAIVLIVTRGRSLLDRIAPVGRMALTNYLMHSVVCTLIFYSYGLGLYGTVGSRFAIPIAIVIFAIQIPLSAWWLSRFRFGPAEWLWRTLTYGKAQPMRVSSL